MEGDCPKAPRTTTEDYTPPPPPPPLTNLPEASSSREKPSTSSKKDVLHMERNRREKMNEFYTMLQSMVPNLFPKAATRARIVDETIAYIKGLEEVIVTLETEKASREALSRPGALRPTQSGSSVDVTVSGGNMAFFGICIAGSRPRLAAQVLEVFEKHKAEVLSSTVACHDGNATMTVTAKVLEEEAVERIKEDLMII